MLRTSLAIALCSALCACTTIDAGSGQLDQTKLGALIQKANTAVPAPIGPGLAAALQSAPDAASLRAQLQTNQPAVNALATAAAS